MSRHVLHLVPVVVVLVLLAASQPVFGGDEVPKAQRKARPTVVILLFEGVELLDFAGPAEVFGVAGEGKSFRVVTVAETPDTLRAMGGVIVKPEFSFKDA